MRPDRWLRKYGKLDQLVQMLLPLPWHRRVMWPFWFLGNYATSGPHVDASNGSVNVYYMARGSKSVQIWTRSASQKMPMVYSKDYLIAADGSTLSRYARYTGILKENSVLVFSNSACLHHFVNMPGAQPWGLSIRLNYAGKVHPLVLETATSSWEMVDYIFSLLCQIKTEGKILRTEFVK